VEQGGVFRMPMLMADVMREPELKEQWVKEFLQPLLEKMEGVFRYLGMQGKYRDLEPSVAVRVVGGMILGFLLLKVLEGDLSPLKKLPEEQVQRTFAGVLLRGVLGEAAE
jgi:hypothetical protein